MNLQTRRILVSASFLLLILIAVLLVRKMRSNAAELAASQQVVVEQPARKVNVLKAVPGAHVLEKEVSGLLVAKDRYLVYTDVPGRMLPTDRAFKRGTYFPKGSVLINLDNETERINLIARKNQLYNAIASLIPDLKLDFPAVAGDWESYLATFNEEIPVRDLPEVSDQKLKLFVSARGIFQQYQQIRAEETRLDKYILHTPISGILTEALVQPGSYVQPGQRLGEITGNYRFEVEMTIQPEDLKFAPVGKEVVITTDADTIRYRGRISKINPLIDAATQSVTAIVDVSGKNLFHGMYVEGHLLTQRLEGTLEIDRNLLLSDESLFVVRGDTLARIAVDVSGKGNGRAYLRGIEEGALILNETSPTFREGMKVTF